ncbi:hypothetical protein SEA_MARSHAWN_86 [Mycobacterium phage Marshawn]|uniref:Uncharacterized protein n=1 Tax=Mycobacterium phage Marshawn TaxID=2652423 RepID=A0A5P8D8V6_9CAUD|nr:hypothetical protein I5H02_gp13 [Mycobacterium phage Marshawn]QFP94872.1 hypothetical protein SEA_MARSHAWN_86 [Mycobacterium phage Marshawn]
MGSARVLFLDGPLAETTRDVPTWQGDNLPPQVFNVAVPRPFRVDVSGTVDDPHAALSSHDTITYRIKPNRLPYGPRWVAAIGEKVGEQIVTVHPYQPEARELCGADQFDEYVEGNARKAAQRFAEAEGLRAVELHEVWRGTRAEAHEQMVREGKPVRGVPPLGEGLDMPGVVFVVHEAVAMPAAVAS